MKPTRNIYFCHECQRTKMLFSTEKKADAFIRWNAEEIAEQNDGKAPCRSYYCISCGGWHVTSSELPKGCATPSERVIRAFERDKDIKAQRRQIRQQAQALSQTQTKEDKQMKEQERLELKAERLKTEAFEHFDQVDSLIETRDFSGACAELKKGIVTLAQYNSQEKELSLPSDMAEMMEMATDKLSLLMELYHRIVCSLIDNGLCDGGKVADFRRTAEHLPAKTERQWQLRHQYTGLGMEMADRWELMSRYSDILRAG